MKTQLIFFTIKCHLPYINTIFSILNTSECLLCYFMDSSHHIDFSSINLEGNLKQGYASEDLERLCHKHRSAICFQNRFRASIRL